MQCYEVYLIPFFWEWKNRTDIRTSTRYQRKRKSQTDRKLKSVWLYTFGSFCYASIIEPLSVCFFFLFFTSSIYEEIVLKYNLLLDFCLVRKLIDGSIVGICELFFCFRSILGIGKLLFLSNDFRSIGGHCIWKTDILIRQCTIENIAGIEPHFTPRPSNTILTKLYVRYHTIFNGFDNVR